MAKTTTTTTTCAWNYGSSSVKEDDDADMYDDGKSWLCLANPPYTEEQLRIMDILNGDADKTKLTNFQAAISRDFSWPSTVTRWNPDTQQIEPVPVEIISICFLAGPDATPGNMNFVRNTIQEAFFGPEFKINAKFVWMPFDNRISEFAANADVIINQAQADAWISAPLAQRRRLAPAVRIDLTRGPVAWSRLGGFIPSQTVRTQGRQRTIINNQVNTQGATMRLGRLDNGPGQVGTVVVHEFMHTLGFIHDHQRADFLDGSTVPLKGNAQILRAWRSLPGAAGWTDEMINQNITQVMAIDTVNSSAGFDPDSIMVYLWPCAAFTHDPGFACNGTSTWRPRPLRGGATPNTKLSYLNKVSLLNLFPFPDSYPHRAVNGEQYIVPLLDAQAEAPQRVVVEEGEEEKEEEEEEKDEEDEEWHHQNGDAKDYNGFFPTLGVVSPSKAVQERSNNIAAIVIFVIVFIVVMVGIVLCGYYGLKNNV
ncbi:unnamed protein product [Rotaria magnacalcarata]|uniref:Peptidase M12A domain-containing protein n=1 Tax=Rotaria magnacalcarata TaxID=392030 RepID=A0A815MH74_9BILA|nr:unnamed protein product [Rotaria magnacalcarata]CAF3754335.1 unnamed protein product [Rotaria magnacalcarata]